MSEFEVSSGRKAVTRSSRAGAHARTLTDWETLGGKVVTKPFLVLAALALIGVILMIYRYASGLGAVTNLSDGYPWGLWITYDVLVGTALGCGGYAVAILVYAFNRWEYHPVVRSAVLTSVFGYTLAGLAIFLDIGRYWNGYKLFLPWTVNFNSVLVEVALCIAAYVRGAVDRTAAQRPGRLPPKLQGRGTWRIAWNAGCRSSRRWASCCPPCTSPPWGR